MLNYKTLELDANNIPIKRMYYRPILEIAQKETTGWSKAEMIKKVKQEVLLPRELSNLTTQSGKSNIETLHIKEAIHDLLFSNSIRHIGRTSYTITNAGKKACREGTTHLYRNELWHAYFEQKEIDWNNFKKKNYNKNTIFYSSNGYISFSRKDWQAVQTNNYKLSYDEYLDAQHNFLDSFAGYQQLTELYFFNKKFGWFTGKIIRMAKEHVLLSNFSINKDHLSTNLNEVVVNKDDLIWLKKDNFTNFQVGDIVSFAAEIFSYLQNENEIMYSLKNPKNVTKIKSRAVTDQDFDFEQRAWNISPFCLNKSYSEIEKEVNKDNYKIKVEYKTTTSASIELVDVLNNIKDKGDFYYPDYTQSYNTPKPIPKTQVYKVYDEDKLIYKTDDYSKLRAYVNRL
ncbi:MAG: hypothetical protein HDS11_02880 [Bacteroides sp.]|nr:hypothetical protein [Bacteroides sp.]